LISIVEAEVEKKISKRVAFLVAESFQNIVKHGGDYPVTPLSSLFGIRGQNNFIHIFSTNKVDGWQKVFLQKRLRSINKLGPHELKDQYIEKLKRGTLSAKGGAGLGLIEMVRRSRREIQTDFIPFDEDKYSFHMQVDLLANPNLLTDEKDVLEISSNTWVKNQMTDHSVVFIYQGEFSDEIIYPMLAILETNLEENHAVGFTIFHASVEMMQNISRHGRKDADGKVRGIFILQRFDSYFYISAANYPDSGVNIIQDKIADINSKKIDQLNDDYRKFLMESVMEDGSSAGVGLIDLRRLTSSNIDIHVDTDSYGQYIILGLKIPVIWSR
ncbi:hypothetical protein JYT72_02840, partial [Crocinitomix catalasitica]|nr:hypothetical protein [Crocinitomix catalasitica]